MPVAGRTDALRLGNYGAQRGAGVSPPKGLSLIACCVQDELEELIAAALGVSWASDIRVASGAPTPPPLRKARS